MQESELNEKSELQIRAEVALTRFRSKARRPLVIEFAGVPKAGKTTTLNQAHAFLKRCGFKVETVIERASVCSIRDKRHFNFNIWTASTTLAQILEKTQDPPLPGVDPDILLLDRGLFDSLSWMSMMQVLQRIRPDERKAVENFLLLPDWRKRVACVIVMTTSPEEAMNRERGLLPVIGSGSIMNSGVIQQMLDNTKQCVQKYSKLFPIFEFDTTPCHGSSPTTTAMAVTQTILDVLENELEEQVLSLSKSQATPFFETGTSIGIEAANRLANMFSSSGDFRPRDEVESDESRVQALPVVVIRNKSGQVLQLRRKESSKSNALHNKLVIWAGGHVRKEDSSNGKTILHCAVRELQEELRLRVSPDELKPLGAVYCDIGGGLSRHLALVFEWQANTDDVNLVLSSTEFAERRGSSQSGQFRGIEDLMHCLQSDTIVEEWSSEILKNLMLNSEIVEPRQPSLF
jgi:predicted NUDIX family phosphoesterase